MSDSAIKVPAIPALISPVDWRLHCACSANWTLGVPVGRGESQPRHATREDGLKGVAKPAIQAGGGTPRAAHEKIAADLACHLGLPVPPVLLWTDPTTRELYAISSWACRQPEVWQNQKGLLSATFVKNCSQFIADITIFHSWIGDTDRNEGNTIVDMESNETDPKLFFIDHAFCFGYNPRFHGHDPAWVTHNYYPAHHIAKTQMSSITDLVEKMQPDLISDVVGRIPDAFLSPDKRSGITQELVRRQSVLRRVLGV